MPYQIVYTSVEGHEMRPPQLADLLKAVREKNERLGVTGLLLYRDGVFLQVLEGERDTVEALYEKIEHDERHRNVLTFHAEPISEREFGEWAMGFRNLSEDDLEKVRDLPGYSDFFAPGHTERQLRKASEESSFAYEALLYFKGSASAST
jgi:hypothetical protein